MISIRYFRQPGGTAELELQQRIEQLLLSNPMLTDPLPLMWHLRPLFGQRWQLQSRSGCLWIYRSSEKLTTRRPMAVIYAGAKAPEPE